MWQAIALPAAPQTPIVLRQFRVTSGPIYNITAFDGVDTITLDRPYAEQGSAGGSYMVYQPYAPAPAVDFKRWMSWVDPINGYRFRYKNLFKTRKEVDRVDPQRTAFGEPYWVAAMDYVVMPDDEQMRPRFELWPHPVEQIGYITEYMVTGDAMPMNILPVTVPDALIIARARHYGHELVANQPTTDIKAKAFHLSALTRADAEYTDLLAKAHNIDNSIFDSRVITEGASFELSGPLDANYMQDHVLFWVG